MYIMNKLQEAEQQARLATAHQDFSVKLNAHAFFKVNNHETGEDLVQITFLKTWGYLVKGGKIDVMKAFLYHILNNLIIDEYRKHKTTSLEVQVENGFEPKDDNSLRLLDFLDGKRAILLIQLLPQTYRKVIRMRYVQDLSLKEMSILTGQTRNAMAVQVHRGLEKLKILYSSNIKI